VPLLSVHIVLHGLLTVHPLSIVLSRRPAPHSNQPEHASYRAMPWLITRLIDLLQRYKVEAELAQLGDGFSTESIAALRDRADVSLPAPHRLVPLGSSSGSI
jgi:hypothetical protein